MPMNCSLGQSHTMRSCHLHPSDVPVICTLILSYSVTWIKNSAHNFPNEVYRPAFALNLTAHFLIPSKVPKPGSRSKLAWRLTSVKGSHHRSVLQGNLRATISHTKRPLVHQFSCTLSCTSFTPSPLAGPTIRRLILCCHCSLLLFFLPDRTPIHRLT
jgi:hypothetical protein